MVRAAGEFDFSEALPRVASPQSSEEKSDGTSSSVEEFHSEDTSTKHDSESHTRKDLDLLDVATYRPSIKKRVWYISETDVNWISMGCYILGTGGGGSPYSHMLRLRGILKDGGIVRIISPSDLKDDDLVGGGGGAGSPSVSFEKLQSDEYARRSITF